jgi:hypothetical protein
MSTMSKGSGSGDGGDEGDAESGWAAAETKSALGDPNGDPSTVRVKNGRNRSTQC